MGSVNPWVALFVFSLYVVADGLYTLWAVAVTERRALKAGVIAGVLFAFLGVGTISFVDTHWYLVPGSLGCVLGTFLATKHSKPRPKATVER